MSNLSQNIRKYREQKSMSQEELAQKLYVTRQTISNYENGKTEPDLDRIEEMAVLFDVDVQELLQTKNKYLFPKKKFILLILLAAVLVIWMIIVSHDIDQMRKYYTVPWSFLILCPFVASVLLSGIGYLIGDVLTESRMLKRVSMPLWVHRISVILTSFICIGLIISLLMYSFHHVFYIELQIQNTNQWIPQGFAFWNQVRANIMLMFSFHPLLYGIFPILGFICSYSKKVVSKKRNET